MGGNIVVRSTPGVGSRFKVTLLLSEVREPVSIPPLAAPIFGYHGPRKTILSPTTIRCKVSSCARRWSRSASS